MTRKIPAVLLVLAFVLSTQALAARPDKDWRSWFGHLSGGYSAVEGDFADILDDGWIIEGGATLWPDGWPAGIDFSLGFTEWDIKKEVIRDIEEAQMNDVNSGDIQSWFVTTNGVWSPGEVGQKVSFGLVGGIGAYRLEGRLRGTGLVYYPPICDPITWICFPGGVAPGQVVKYKGDTTEVGFNVGIDVNFELASGSQVYLEIKYHSIDADETLEFIPVVVGFRW